MLMRCYAEIDYFRCNDQLGYRLLINKNRAKGSLELQYQTMLQYQSMQIDGNKPAMLVLPKQSTFLKLLGHKILPRVAT